MMEGRRGSGERLPSQGSALWVGDPGRPATRYEVRIQAGSLHALGALSRDAVPACRYAVVSDNRVGELYGEAALSSFREAGVEATLFTFPAGERHKNRHEWIALSDRLLRAGFGRDCAVVALGGGVTGDIAGFVAATYMRGVPVVQAPTTLLAMVDASVGGKTGVDTEVGKNLIGAFHHPRLVVVDPELLQTLPRPQLVSGLAEVVKMGAILDADFFDWLESQAPALVGADPAVLERALARCVQLKAEVVGSDPEDRGRRAILNFGHTVGHALELLGGYTVLHGEAVAAGMRVEARLGEKMELTEAGTADRLVTLLDLCGLDRRLEEERPASAVCQAMLRDKKALGGAVRCVFLRRIGETARGSGGTFSFELPPDATERLEVALRPEEDR